jgi:hypothetical protein
VEDDAEDESGTFNDEGAFKEEEACSLRLERKGNSQNIANGYNFEIIEKNERSGERRRRRSGSLGVWERLYKRYGKK